MSSKPLLDIGDKEWHLVEAILQRHVPDRDVWAFGSRAKWTAKEFSDLDLAILGETSLTLDESAALADAFAESDLPWKVDVVDWATTSSSFRKIIERDKVVVQCPSKFETLESNMRSERFLSDIAEIVMGQSPSGDTCNEKGNGVPLLNGPTEFGDKYPRPIQFTTDAKKKALPGDLLFCVRGSTTGRMNWADQQYAIGRGLAAIRGKDGYPNSFVRAVIEANLQKLLIQATGSTFPNVSRDLISALPIPNIDQKSAKVIASIVEPLDDRISLLRETNMTLEAIAQALFKSWFVDFDPVHAKMQGRAPDGMDEPTAALFPDSFEESELGPVPRGWSLKPFGKLLSHTIGGDWGSDVPDGKNDIRVAIIRGTDIPDLQTCATSRVPIRFTSGKKLLGRKLEDGDILLEVSGGSKDQPTGRSLYLSSNLLDQFDCPVEPASFCRLLRPVNKDVGLLLAQHLIFIYAQGKTWEYQNQSTGIANFQTTHFLETELVACPSIEILNVFAENVRTLIYRAHLTQIQELAALRDALLPRLISGQLSLENKVYP